MRQVLGFVLLGLALAGCSSAKGTRPAAAGGTPPAQPQVVTTPSTLLIGKIVRVNNAGRFAVLSFPVGTLPRVGNTVSVYRKGLKVGEIHVTGPQQNDDIVGDIMTGEAMTGDEVRSE